MNKAVDVLMISLFSIVLPLELTAQPLVIAKAPDTLLYVADNGNVGIGTSTPGRVLHVKATANEIARFETTSASGNSFLSLNNATGQFANLGRFDNGTDDYFFLDLDGGGFGEFIVTNSGKVGIGAGVTPTPLSKLHVVSNNRYAGYFTSDSLGNDAHVIHAEYNGSSGARSPRAVFGQAVASPGSGVGGEFQGGSTGVLGIADEPGDGFRYGVTGVAKFGNGTNYGVRGEAFFGVNAYGVLGTAGQATNNNYAVYAAGDLAYSGSLISASDAKLKENSRPVSSALAKIRQLNGRQYNFTKQSQYASMNLAEGVHYGLVAQEVEKVLPELVVDAVHPGATDAEGSPTREAIPYKGVKYLELLPILIEAIKEQQAQIEALEAQVAQLRGR